MSFHTRKANMVPPPTTSTNSGSRVEKAKEAIKSLSRNDTPKRFREVWQELRQAYEDTVYNNGPFPVWALSQFDPGYLEKLLTTGYSQDLRYLRTCAPFASLNFQVSQWQFILFFDSIDRARAKALNNISKERPGLTLSNLYDEVQKNRLNRIKNQKNPKYEFLPRDFKACLKESDNDDGSDAEVEHEERNDNGNNPENGDPAPADVIGLKSHESDYTAGHDDQDDDDLEDLDDLMNNAMSRSSQPGVSSLPIIIRDKADEMNGDGEAATPAVSTPQAANVAIRRGMSREQSWSLDPLADEGIFSSIEEQLFQKKRSIFLEFEQLKASVKTANEITEKRVRELNEENAASAETARQILSNPNATYEDMQPVLDRLGYKVGNNNRKRKSREDENDQMGRFVAELENSELQAFIKKTAL
ncbi:hypothetical protein ACQKWADRAFT_301816 [Trichoderma austrokoningii]